MIKILVSFVMLSAFVNFSPVFCQEDLESALLKQMKEKTVRGKAGEIDFVGSTLVLSVNGQAMLFSVTDEASIYRASEKIFLNDIEIGDDLTVKYYDSDSEPYKVISIIDNNLGNE